MKTEFKKISLKAICLLCIMAVASLCFVLTGCGNSNEESSSSTTSSDNGTRSESTSDEITDGNTAVIEVKDYGTITVELDEDTAPITVANFKKLVSEGFYDGLTFHRIINGFMIQGGDPLGTGTGGSDETIKGEFSANGVENNISHTRGVISMARKSTSYDSANSQFFIVQQDSTYLDGQYAAFGHVTDGMDVVDEIAANTPVTDSNGSVAKKNQPVITSITLK
jgi:peptidyl-prolyl cis-trans isomerase B (cyclophilin B)